MKIINFIFSVSFLFFNSAYSFVFGNHPTICKPKAFSNCYNVSYNTPGYLFIDFEKEKLKFVKGGKIDENDDAYKALKQKNIDQFDELAKCKGKKIICKDALNGGFENKVLSKDEINDPSIVSQDFDFDVFLKNKNCFGVRKTIDNGIYALKDNKYVKVWCKNIPMGQTEDLPNGKIISDSMYQPTCENLAQKNILDIQKANCFGELLSADYSFVCDTNSSGTSPKYIIKNPNTINSFNQITSDEVNMIFNHMKRSAEKARRKRG